MNKWPGQEEVAGDSKVCIFLANYSMIFWFILTFVQIPSLVAYEGSRPVAFGAEATEYEGMEGFYVAKWFKVCPPGLSKMRMMTLPYSYTFILIP